VTLGAFALCSPGLDLRPQLFGLALFAATVLVTATRRSHPGRTWLLPILFVVWANVHGSFVLGLVIVALALVQDLLERAPAARRTAGIATLCVVATFVTPFGPRVWPYAVGIGTNSLIRRFIEEWAAPHIGDLAGALFFLSVAWIGWLLATRRTAVRTTDLLTIGVFFAVGLWAIRGVYFWGIAAAPIAAGLIAGDRRRETAEDPGNRVANSAIVAFVAVLGISLLPGFRERNPIAVQPLLAEAPAGVTAALRAHLEPGDRLLVPQAWGSWAEFAFPDNPVAVDSRIEVIPATVWRDYLTVAHASEGWDEVLDRWNVDVVVARRGFEPRLVTAMAADPAWREAYRDDESVVFLRG
jgi:hypothetical protein